ncbi:hypothetical protein R3P38DRAFT_2957229 [Favolaschia claudopus]|uniref:Uncharacterized protein n=1 Tax=Favolaschia claudopus TaxID=2862362 RepID=A0AAW0BA84_9AGAR
MNDPSPRLSLSAIIRDRAPTVWCAGDDYDELLGTYCEAANVTRTLLKGKMNIELAAIEYTPAAPYSFDYMRHAYVGANGSTVTYEGDVFGENMSPLIRICLPDRRPWPEHFRRSAHERKYPHGSSLPIFADDWQGSNDIHPESSLQKKLQKRSVELVPDVPNQSLEDMEPVVGSGREQDSTVRLGWHETWATAMLENRDHYHPLGNMTDIFWDPAEEWGVEMHLQRHFDQVMSVNEVEPWIYEEQDEDSDPLESRGVESYEVRATILRVFVKNSWFIRARQEPENQDEEDTSGSDSEGEHEDDVEWM